MKRTKRIMLGVFCVLLLLISWIVAMTAKSNAEKQQEWIAQAKGYLEDEIYVRAVEPLEQAAAFEDVYTLQAEEMLKDVYTKLIQQQGYRKSYTQLLDKQMARADASPEVYIEAAEYYLSVKKYDQAFSALRNGIDKTGSQQLIDFYEDNRYVYKMGRLCYDEVTSGWNGAIQVKEDGKWGIASANGSPIIPCEYDAVSTYSTKRAIVRSGSVISAVDSNNNRIALLHKDAIAFGNFENNRLALHTTDGWIMANGDLKTASTVYEELGMFSEGYAAAKKDGKWGVVDRDDAWLIEPIYDGVVTDELGRCYGQNVVFVRRGGKAILLSDGEEIASFDNALPFADGWAAVKQNGKWGFVDTQGQFLIEPQFDDALSFGQHLAAVKVGGLWGYVNVYGKIVIEPQYREVKSFHHGSAPVLTQDGWKFITLIEYEEEASL